MIKITEKVWIVLLMSLLLIAFIMPWMIRVPYFASIQIKMGQECIRKYEEDKIPNSYINVYRWKGNKIFVSSILYPGSGFGYKPLVLYKDIRGRELVINGSWFPPPSSLNDGDYSLRLSPYLRYGDLDQHGEFIKKASSMIIRSQDMDHIWVNMTVWCTCLFLIYSLGIWGLIKLSQQTKMYVLTHTMGRVLLIFLSIYIFISMQPYIFLFGLMVIISYGFTCAIKMPIFCLRRQSELIPFNKIIFTSIFILNFIMLNALFYCALFPLGGIMHNITIMPDGSLNFHSENIEDSNFQNPLLYPKLIF